MNKFLKIILFTLGGILILFTLVSRNAKLHLQTLPDGTTLNLEKDEVFILADASIYVFNFSDPFCKTQINYLREHASTLPLAIKNRCVLNEKV